MIVYLLRHGIAADHGPRGDDAGRELTTEGIDKLERAARGWRRVLGRIDRVLASPLVRAQQTAAILGRVAGNPEIETCAQLIPSARPLAILERLQAGLLADLEGLALVGHEPHLGGLFGLLVTGSERCAIPLKKGMLVAVEIESSATMLGRLVAAMSQRVAGDL